METAVPDAESGGSHPARGAWIEMYLSIAISKLNMSHPARGAWIEIIAKKCRKP